MLLLLLLVLLLVLFNIKNKFYRANNFTAILLVLKYPLSLWSANHTIATNYY